MKAVFIFDISYGQEVFIPHILRQKHYPDSCKFYDPIISICLDGIPDDRKQYFYFQNVDRIAEYKKYNKTAEVYEKFFGSDTKN